ncbi:hypothetical protein OsJ_02366 [Oryza sativa Japonica Group]|uniref:Uncharacterized protein n=1 Tax=Oryza sativa subsp. japonica TaxID=39947 RepID=A2ZUS3_ORYSJ|nr:hypothetical protein OsJ_02366 [Oryza sativa Japonica Group]
MDLSSAAGVSPSYAKAVETYRLQEGGGHGYHDDRLRGAGARHGEGARRAARPMRGGELGHDTRPRPASGLARRSAAPPSSTASMRTAATTAASRTPTRTSPPRSIPVPWAGSASAASGAGASAADGIRCPWCRLLDVRRLRGRGVQVDFRPRGRRWEVARIVVAGAQLRRGAHGHGAGQARRRERELKIYMNESWSWRGIVHHHPATFDTVAMDPGLKRSIVADLDPGQGVEARIEQQSLTLSGLLNFIDGLWSTSGEERVVVFTLHHQLQGTPRRGAAPAGADGHACSPAWTPRRPRCRRCCCAASDDVDAALRALVEFLQEKKRAMCRSHQEQSSLKVQSLR